MMSFLFIQLSGPKYPVKSLAEENLLLKRFNLLLGVYIQRKDCPVSSETARFYLSFIKESSNNLNKFVKYRYIGFLSSHGGYNCLENSSMQVFIDES